MNLTSGRLRGTGGRLLQIEFGWIERRSIKIQLKCNALLSIVVYSSSHVI